jgi:predicted Rossmann fold flavoprotein
VDADIIVVGAGAAGLLAAGTAAGCGARVLLLEKMEKPARKLRITGKGRCNITNLRGHGEFLGHVRANAEFFAPAFEAFDNLRTVEFFKQIGLEVVRERGERLFPASGRAQDVAEALIRWAREQGVRIECRRRVLEILPGRGVRTEQGVEKAPITILCTGGVSYPATGSTGDGYGMAHASGHSIEPLRPSLVSLYGQGLTPSRGLALRNISVGLIVDGRRAATEFGELEFAGSRNGGGQTEIAGPVTLRLSRMAVDALIEGCAVELALDLKPALDLPTLTRRIESEKAALRPSDRFESLLRKLMPAQMTGPVARAVGIPAQTPLRAAGGVRRLAETLKDLRLPVTGHAPLEEAIVTAGGVDVGDVDPLSMRSRIVPGLYFAGEVLDMDADTGGYNLQIAFSTGYLAGLSAAKANLILGRWIADDDKKVIP